MVNSAHLSSLIAGGEHEKYHRKPISAEKEIKISDSHDSYMQLEIGSGVYHYVVKK